MLAFMLVKHIPILSTASGAALRNSAWGRRSSARAAGVGGAAARRPQFRGQKKGRWKSRSLIENHRKTIGKP